MKRWTFLIGKSSSKEGQESLELRKAENVILRFLEGDHRQVKSDNSLT